jgi:hypothetical protein
MKDLYDERRLVDDVGYLLMGHREINTGRAGKYF